MKESGVPDSLTVINGPEDGAEFSIVRVPAAIGQDPSCSILIRLDRLVQPIHAHLTAVSEGYRVRCATRAPVWVNGLRGGRARSRILRHGDRLTIGNTELILECAPDGLAHRSRGISTDGDLLWAVKRGVAGVAAIAAGVFAELQRLYPDDVAARQMLLKSRVVTAGSWVAGGHHTVPVVDGVLFIEGCCATDCCGDSPRDLARGALLGGGACDDASGNGGFRESLDECETPRRD